MNNILSKNELLCKKLPSGKLLSEKLNMSETSRLKYIY